VAESSVQFDLIWLNTYKNLILTSGHITELSDLFQFSHAVQPVTQWFDH